MTTAAEHRIRGSTALVTGGCGFIGSHLVQALLARGAAEVRVIDDMRCGDPANLGERDNVRLARLAIGDASAAELAEQLRGVDYLFHLAAEKHCHAQSDAAGMLRSNVTGTQALYDQAGLAGVKKIVFASSLYAYGRRRGEPFVETELATPDTIYGASKLAGEHLLAWCGEAHGCEWNVLRYLFVYGPRQFAGGGYRSVIVRTSERLLAGERPQIYGDGTQTLDYVYVDDVAKATLRAVEAPVSGEVLNVGSGIGRPVGELIRTLTTISETGLEPEHAPADGTTGTSRVANVEKIRRLLGWEPTTTLDEGLRRTYAWLAEEQQRAT